MKQLDERDISAFTYFVAAVRQDPADVERLKRIALKHDPSPALRTAIEEIADVVGSGATNVEELRRALASADRTPAVSTARIIVGDAA